MLVLSASFTARPGAEPAILELAAMLMPLSRAEPGCVRYDFLQAPHTPDQFMFFELWKSRADLDAHFETPYYKILVEKLPALIVGEVEMLTYDTPGPKPCF